MNTKELLPTKPWEEKVDGEPKYKEMKGVEEKLFQQFTEAIVSHLIRSGEISSIHKNSLIVLKNILNPPEEKIISDILGFNLKTIDLKNAIEERKVAANFLIEGIGETLTKISNKKDLSGAGASLLENFRNLKFADKNYDAVNEIKEILYKHWLGDNSNPDDSNQKLAEAKKILTFIGNNPKLGISTIARIFNISTTKLDSIKKKFMLDEKGNMVPREESTIKSEYIAGLNGREVHINSALRVLRYVNDHPEEKDSLKIARAAGLSPKVSKYCIENFKLDKNGKIALREKIPNSIGQKMKH